MSKYKVGDKVRIREDLVSGKMYGEYYVINEMLQYRGEKATIEVILDGGYELDIDEEWTWTDEMFESYIFTKSDLEDGMVGITREGRYYIYLCGKFRRSNGKTYWGYDSELSNDLKSVCGLGNFDFIRICTSSAKVLDDWCKEEFLTTIWESTELKTLTIKEAQDKLCEMLGEKIKIIEN